MPDANVKDGLDVGDQMTKTVINISKFSSTYNNIDVIGFDHDHEFLKSNSIIDVDSTIC